MKLIKTREAGLEENFLELHYDEIDDATSSILERLRGSLGYIEGNCDDKKVTVGIMDIFYFEVVDRKLFAYTKDSCVEARIALKDIIDDFSKAGFVRISKSCVVNLYKVARLQGDLNMRVIVFLKNGEKLVMNRSYKKDFYDRLNKISGGKNK